MARIHSTQTIRLIRALQVNEWSDKAREASAKKRKQKAQSGGSWLGTAGKAALIGGGALIGGALGARTLSRLAVKGRLLRAGENLTGKIVATTKGHIKPSSLIPAPKGRNMEMVLRRLSRKKGLRGAIGKGLQKADEFLGVPKAHFGVGTAKNRIADYSVSGQASKPRGEFSKFWNQKWKDPGGEIRVVSEGKVAGKSGKARKAEIKALGERAQKVKGWKGDEICDIGDKNCESFARSIGEGKQVSKLVRAVKLGTAGGAVAGAAPGTALMIPRKKKGQVNNLLQVINGGPGSGFHGHKGIKGHRGGSLPEGFSTPSGRIGVRESRALIPAAPLSESPQARAKRIKNVYTKSSRLADTYEAYVGDLEKKRKRRFLPLKKQDVETLARAHAKAAENFYASADQATLLKGRSQEEQVARLHKADFHAQEAMKYHKRLGGKAPGAVGKFTRELGKAFVSGLARGTLETAYQAGGRTAQVGLDIAGEAVRGGVRQSSIKTEEQKSIKDQIREILKATGGAAKERAAAHRDAFARSPSMDTDLEATRRTIQQIMDDRAQLDARAKKAGITTTGRTRKGRGNSQTSSVPQTIGAGGKPVQASSADIEDILRAKAAALKTNEFTANFSPITANLSGKVRRETLHDREYLVAPLSMIVPGVLPGSKGPLLYPEDEVSKNPGAWNGIPIVVNHPMKDGVPVEARSPDILDKYQIGTVFNARYSGKLVAEGWFDVDRTRKTNIGIYQRLVNNEPQELSTGLYTDNEPFEGTWNGRDYKYIARNYRPDHLAILLTSKGACSIQDGCGVLINACGSKKKKAFKKAIIRNEVSQLVDNIAVARLASPWKAVASHLGSAGRIAGAELKPAVKAAIKSPVKSAKTAGSKVVSFTKKHPKTALGITGVAAYKYGRRKERKKQVQNALSPLTKKRFKQAAGFGGGLVAGGVGAVKGAALGSAAGTAIAPGVGTAVGGIIGGAAGAALGAWGANRIAKKYGGKHAAQGANVGGLVGSFATPGGLGKGVARLAGKKAVASTATKVAATGSKTARFAKGAGKVGLDAGTFIGTTAALDKGFGPKVRKPRSAHIQNAWTDAARRKSAETRKRNASARGGMNSGQHAAGGLAAGIVVARVAGGKIEKGLQLSHIKTGAREVKRVVKRSFEPAIKYKHDPVSGRNIMYRQPVGVGRKTLRLLKRIGPRVGSLLRMIRK